MALLCSCFPILQCLLFDWWAVHLPASLTCFRQAGPFLLEFSFRILASPACPPAYDLSFFFRANQLSLSGYSLRCQQVSNLICIIEKSWERLFGIFVDLPGLTPLSSLPEYLLPVIGSEFVLGVGLESAFHYCLFWTWHTKWKIVMTKSVFFQYIYVETFIILTWKCTGIYHILSKRQSPWGQLFWGLNISILAAAPILVFASQMWPYADETSQR